MVDENKLHQFVHQMLGDLGGALTVPLVRIGDRLGLYKALHANGPMTPGELAMKTDIAERYAREWPPAATAIPVRSARQYLSSSPARRVSSGRWRATPCTDPADPRCAPAAPSVRRRDRRASGGQTGAACFRRPSSCSCYAFIGLFTRVRPRFSPAPDRHAPQYHAGFADSPRHCAPPAGCLSSDPSCEGFVAARSRPVSAFVTSVAPRVVRESAVGQHCRTPGSRMPSAKDSPCDR